MANRPIVATEMQKCQRETHNEFTQEIDEVVSDFIARLNSIAEKHRQFFFFFFFYVILTDNDLSYCSTVPYVLSLAGISGSKKLSKQNTTAFSMFCGMKLQEENGGKLSIPSLKHASGKWKFP